MNQYYAERQLCWCYGMISLLLGVSVICIGVPYNHWKATLDVCPGGYFENTNCGCIFYGVSTFQYFTGGHNSTCLYSVFAPLPILVYAIIMALFHMYRVCINNIGKYEDENTTDMEEIMMGSSTAGYPHAALPPSSELRATGDHATAIHFRLACQAIYDFMDYLQKDAPNSRRGDFINTGVALQLAIISSYLAVALWATVAVRTALRAYRERHVLTCCGN
ncbi:Uncharacterized protein OBRU01_06596 [Operophtera brumata]|uniref:Uncharacterized protein n=1 Tax=Operophtera brumata TaxID=104452 RepID=A0A0L7LG58_OPEBR|nr:Uncharacterized protein OBRU01_06596 [Operophtera brumata]